MCYLLKHTIEFTIYLKFTLKQKHLQKKTIYLASYLSVTHQKILEAYEQKQIGKAHYLKANLIISKYWDKFLSITTDLNIEGNKNCFVMDLDLWWTQNCLKVIKSDDMICK